MTIQLQSITCREMNAYDFFAFMNKNTGPASKLYAAVMASHRMRGAKR